jgi:multidrug efflux pump subunit AcrA (membrane-fusion protein)
MRGFLLAACCVALLPSAEGWKPAEHPAQVQRPVSGLTRPLRVIPVASEVAGRVRDPGPALGAVVGDDDWLRLDDSLIQADRSVAAAAEAQAAAEAAYRAREAQRFAGLFSEGRVSEGERDAAAHAADAARLAHERAAAEVARATRLLDHHRVRLPVGWRVLARHREAGAVVPPGEAVLTLGDLAAVVVTLHLAEEEIAALPRAIASVAGATLPIAAVRISELADAQSRKRPVEIELPGAAGGGREALITLTLPDPSGALVVPEGHIRAALDGRFVRTSDGRSLRVTVLRSAGDGLLAVLPTPELATAELLPP